METLKKFKPKVMKTPEQLQRRIQELEFANERLYVVNKYQADNIEFLLSHKPWYYRLVI